MFANRQRVLHCSFRRPALLLCVTIAMCMVGCASTPTRESTGGYIDDSTITAKIKADVLQDNKLSASDVHVKTYKGVVDLSGFVNRESDISEAGVVAERVS
jgi:osmotically-inducible protein OsmY